MFKGRLQKDAQRSHSILVAIVKARAVLPQDLLIARVSFGLPFRRKLRQVVRLLLRGSLRQRAFCQNTGAGQGGGGGKKRGPLRKLAPAKSPPFRRFHSRSPHLRSEK